MSTSLVPDIPDASNASETESFNEQEWRHVLEAMESAYAQSLEYQTQIEQQNETIQQAHQFISDVVSAMSDLLIVTDRDHHIIQVNRSFCEMTGYREEEVLHHPVERFIQLPKAFTTIASPQFCDAQATLQGKHQTFDIAISCNCHQANATSFQGLVIVARPIGELRQAYEALKKAHIELAATQDQMLQTEKMAALGRLVAGIAHELNTPLSVIKGNLWTLQHYSQTLLKQTDTLPDPLTADWQSLLEDTQQATEQATQIIQELKRFSHPRLNQHDQSFPLKESVNTAISWVTATHRDQSVQIECQLPDNLHLIGNASALQQVLINLLQNALQAMEKVTDPHIQIHGDTQNTQLILTLKDNGPGIPNDKLPHIFDPFYTTQEVGKGTGLGLSISYQLIQQMDGELQAWNDIDTGGAVFQITLPLEENVTL